MRRLKRVLIYLWAGPTTLVGLLAGGLTLLTGGRAQLRRGVLEFYGGLADLYPRFADKVARRFGRRFDFVAITLGHVILARNAHWLDVCRDHEHVHVRQVERWGPFFLPAYVLASLWAALRGGRIYRDNPFESDAYDHS